MILFLDVGNTAAKWRFRDGRSCQQGGVNHGRDWCSLLGRLDELLAGVDLAHCYIASVAGREDDAVLARLFESELGVLPRFYYSMAEDFGVRNSYLHPEQMGVDRWVALIEAYRLSESAAIVIDSGSAITIDGLSAKGEHVGGYIVPGMRMMEAALLAKTASVRFQSNEGWSGMGPGRSTAECVHNGVLKMAVSFIEETVVALQNDLQDTCSVYVTGGDAASLLPWLSDEGWQVLPDMVLDGLERVFSATE